jgi:hypothetical protein
MGPSVPSIQMLECALTDIGELYKTVRNLHKEGATKNPHDPNRRCKEQGVDPFTTTQLKALDKSCIKYERIISLAAGLLSVNLAGRHSDVSCSPSPIFRGNEYNPKCHRQVKKPAHC